MSTARALNRAQATLSGIESKNGFLSEETLLRLVQNDSFVQRIKRYSTESLRSFRDEFREFARQMDKLSRKNLMSQRGREIQDAWIENCCRYLGYKDFKEKSVAYWGDEGRVSYRASETGGHSVALFFYAGTSQVGSLDEAKAPLTDPKGHETFKPQRKESFAEQVEKAMRLAEAPEALLITPLFVAYFRADSKVTGSCLEIRWSDVFRSDNDDAAVLATTLLHADFFEYTNATTGDQANSEESEENDEAEDDEDGAAGGSTGAVKGTASQDLFKEDLAQARRITEDLHKQVMLALEILANERLDVDGELSKRAKQKAHNEVVTQALFKDGLFVLYRMLFVLYAEARRFLPVENPRYASFYSIEHLRDWAEDHLKAVRLGEADGNTTYIWNSLKTIFTLLRRGVQLPGGESVSAYNGQLFSPHQAPSFDEGPALRDFAMARVLTTISRIGGDDSSRRLHFGNLGVEQLGAVYEALLAQKPVIVREPSCWVVAHPFGVGLVSNDFAEKLGLTVVAPDEAQGLRTAQRRGGSRGSKSEKRLSDFVAKNRPGYDPKPGRFIIAPMGGQRRQTASHYTPPKLAEFLVRRTLKPLVEGKSSKEILSLKIVEPAVGSGGFLIACLRYVAPHLLDAKRREGHLDLRGREPTFMDLQACKREILERCLYGVDINPLSLELCRTSLYLEALVPGQPLPFLHHRLKSGNALVYADLLGRSQASLSEGVVPNTEQSSEPLFPAIFHLPVEEVLQVETSLWEAWDEAQVAHGRKANSKELAEILKDRSKDLKAERKELDEHEWQAWAQESQHRVRSLHDLSKKAIEEFETLQQSNDVVDSIEARHMDRLSLVPDMDPILIEAADVQVDPKIERQRRTALIREHGIKTYSKLVRHQRAFMRLKAFCDLHTALWFWPVDDFRSYPSHSTFKELVNWLLSEKGLERGTKASALSRHAFDLLRKTAQIAKREQFVQWHVEFAQVFASQNPGFNALISNPPWKLVRVRDKDVYPTFDPEFLKVSSSSGKSLRIKTIQRIFPGAAQNWFKENYLVKRITQRWQSGSQSDLAMKGQQDLSALFVLSGERLIRERDAQGRHGRIGLLVSRSSLLVNGGTKEIREHFFGGWGLEESISFVNLMRIFSIDSRYEFTCLVGQPGKKCRPRFVHGVVDPNHLDSLTASLDCSDSARSAAQHRPVEMTLDLVSRCFSKSTFAIPSLTDPRQIEIASALHGANSSIVYLPELSIHPSKGVDPTGKHSGSVFLSDQRKDDAQRILLGTHPKYVGLLRGRHFSLEGQRVPTLEDMIYGIPKEKVADRLNSFEGILAWRLMSSSSNQRTLITSLLAGHYWYDGNVFGLMGSQAELTILELILQSIQSDFLIRMTVSGAVNLTAVQSLPVSNFSTKFLTEAKAKASKARSEEGQPVLDALMWLHYGQNKGALNRENLIWMLDTQFDCLKRNNPNYIKQVAEAFDHYSAQRGMFGVDPTPVFKLKAPEVAEVKVLEEEKAKRRIAMDEAGSKKRKRA